MGEDLSKDNWENPDKVKDFARNYAARYEGVFWERLESIVPDMRSPVIADFGCGPGLWLVDAAARFQATKIYGLDASRTMLEYAGTILKDKASHIEHELHHVNFDTDPIPLEESILDLAFGGYMLHEMADALAFLRSILLHIKKGGICVVFDFVSGGVEQFVQQMVARGWDEEQAINRYPHMCKYSAADIERMMKDSGFRIVGASVIEKVRAITVGVRE